MIKLSNISVVETCDEDVYTVHAEINIRDVERVSKEALRADPTLSAYIRYSVKQRLHSRVYGEIIEELDDIIADFEEYKQPLVYKDLVALRGELS